MKKQYSDTETISKPPENTESTTDYNFGAKRIKIEGVDYDLVNEYMKIFTRHENDNFFFSDSSETNNV